MPVRCSRVVPAVAWSIVSVVEDRGPLGTVRRSLSSGKGNGEAGGDGRGGRCRRFIIIVITISKDTAMACIE